MLKIDIIAKKIFIFIVLVLGVVIPQKGVECAFPVNELGDLEEKSHYTKEDFDIILLSGPPLLSPEELEERVLQEMAALPREDFLAAFGSEFTYPGPGAYYNPQNACWEPLWDTNLRLDSSEKQPIVQRLSDDTKDMSWWMYDPSKDAISAIRYRVFRIHIMIKGVYRYRAERSARAYFSKCFPDATIKLGLSFRKMISERVITTATITPLTGETLCMNIYPHHDGRPASCTELPSAIAVDWLLALKVFERLGFCDKWHFFGRDEKEIYVVRSCRKKDPRFDSLAKLKYAANERKEHLRSLCGCLERASKKLSKEEAKALEVDLETDFVAQQFLQQVTAFDVAQFMLAAFDAFLYHKDVGFLQLYDGTFRLNVMYFHMQPRGRQGVFAEWMLNDSFWRRRFSDDEGGIYSILTYCLAKRNKKKRARELLALFEAGGILHNIHKTVEDAIQDVTEFFQEEMFRERPGIPIEALRFCQETVFKNIKTFVHEMESLLPVLERPKILWDEYVPADRREDWDFEEGDLT